MEKLLQIYSEQASYNQLILYVFLVVCILSTLECFQQNVFYVTIMLFVFVQCVFVDRQHKPSKCFVKLFVLLLNFHAS